MQNRVLMGSPRFSATGSRWSRWINAESRAHGISLFLSDRKYVISLDQCRIVCSWDLPRFSPTGSTWSRWIIAKSCAHGISPFFTHSKYVISLDHCRIVCWWDLLVFHPQIVRDLVGSMQNSMLMESPRFSPTGSTWSRWINAESCDHGISPFFTHRKYVISLDECRIVCSWPFFTHREYVISLDQCRIVCSCDLPIFHSQEVRDLVGLMQNRMLMGSPRFSPTVCTWSLWIDEQFCAYGISPCFTHRQYVLSLDQCKIVCSWDLPVFHPQ